MGCKFSTKRREGPPPVVDLYAAQPYSGRVDPAGEGARDASSNFHAQGAPGATDEDWHPETPEALISNAHLPSKVAPKPSGANGHKMSVGASWHPDDTFHDLDPDWHPVEEFAMIIASANISSKMLSAATNGASNMLDLDAFIHLVEEVKIPAPSKLLVDVFHHQLATDSGGGDNPRSDTHLIDTAKLFDAVAGAIPKLFDSGAGSSDARVDAVNQTHKRVSAHVLKQHSVRKHRRATAFRMRRSAGSQATIGEFTTLSTLEAHAEESLDLPERYVSLVAHNDMKPSMMMFVATHLEFFKQRRIVTTGSTGRALEQKLGLEVALKVSSGPLGGDQEIGAMISKGEVAAVFFFRDPLSAHPHESDILALGRICDVHNIIVATNTSTGGSVIHALQEAAAFRDQLHISPADFYHQDSEVVKQYKDKQKAAIAAVVADPAAVPAVKLPADKLSWGNTHPLIESSII